MLMRFKFFFAMAGIYFVALVSCPGGALAQVPDPASTSTSASSTQQSGQGGTQMQLLPPTDFRSPTPCAGINANDPNYGNYGQILAFTNAGITDQATGHPVSAINCVPGFLGDKLGNVVVGGSMAVNGTFNVDNTTNSASLCLNGSCVKDLMSGPTVVNVSAYHAANYAADPQSPWLDTGVNVQAGSFIFLSADGYWAWKPGVPVSADGYLAPPDYGAAVPLFYAPIGALVGRIGLHGAPFLVGRSDIKYADINTSGELYLIMNDDIFNDNSGYVTATISTVRK